MKVNRSSTESRLKANKSLSRLAAFGAESPEYSLDSTTIGKLWPSLLSASKIEFDTSDEGLMSVDLYERLISKGAVVDTVPFHYYRDATYAGQVRQSSNEDWIRGKAPLYYDLAHADRVRKACSRLVDAMLSYYKPRESSSVLARMELEDLEKVTAQQWKPTGWFLESPVTEAVVPHLGSEARAHLREVAQEYGRILSLTGLREASWEDLVLMDSDPPDTMTGAPTYLMGERTHEARMAILAALPSPTSRSVDEFIAGVEALNDRIGFPPAFIYSPVVSTRMGPRKKSVPLWMRVDGGYVKIADTIGMFNRTRYVYPAPYWLNFMLSPIYEQMSHVRMRKLGLWHDPDSQAKYIERLRKQGKYAYAIDFSGMDTGMFPHIIEAILQELLDAGFNRRSCELFLKLYPSMGVVYPDYGGRPESVTFLSGPVRPWCSGFKLTSEFDTIYGASVLLTCLDRQVPGILEKWKRGEWVFAELGDDIIFTIDQPLNHEQLASDALSLWGATLKIQEDAMFLKWMLPIVPEIPKKTKPFSRFLQQTLYNEDRYDGVEGGERPGAIMRLALMARMSGLSDHPDFTKWWPSVFDVISQLKYVAEASPGYRAHLSAGTPCLDIGDEEAILQYALRMPSFFANLEERAKFEPSAALLWSLCSKLGLKEVLPEPDVRRMYLDLLLREPTERDISVLTTLTAPYVE